VMICMAVHCSKFLDDGSPKSESSLPIKAGMTGQALSRLFLPSLSLTVAELAALLLRDGVSRIVEHFFDLCQRDDLGVVFDMNRLGRNIDVNLAHAVQFANGSLDGVLAVLTRNVGGHECR